MNTPKQLADSTRDALVRASKIHIMGVCGTAMGTLAGLLQARGVEVRGSDRAFYPPMSELLTDWGVETFSGYSERNLDWDPDFVIVGNVIRRDNPEAVAMREGALPHASFPAAFSEICLQDKRPVVVTGTHGKTTTTSLTAWILENAGLAPSLLVGGLPRNFGSSFRLSDGRHFVVEGDEYDTAYFDKVPKFLHYRPMVGVITNIEFDHADIYDSVEHIEAEFERFAQQIPPEGRLLVCHHSERATRIARTARCQIESYGVEAGYWSARQLHSNAEYMRFDLYRGEERLGTITTPLFGTHNVQNCVAALAVAIGEGVPFSAAAGGASSFENVAKRHEIKGVVGGITVIDDFAHHPTAVAATVRAVQERFPKGRLFCCFEIESNTSRRRIFQDAYAPAFDGSEAVIFCKPLEKDDGLPEDERLQLDVLIETIQSRGVTAKLIPEVRDIVEWLQRELRPGDVVLGMSGRHFYGLHKQLLEALSSHISQ